MADEKMDVEEQIECLNRALRLQHRSVLQYSLVAGSVIGLEYQAHADKMREHSLSELEDATRLVEKIAALGGEPTTDVAPISFNADPGGGDRATDRRRGRDARGAPGGDRADRARGRVRGGRAPAGAHDHAQAGAGRLPAASAAAPLIARSSTPAPARRRGPAHVTRTTRIPSPRGGGRERGPRGRPGACGGPGRRRSRREPDVGPVGVDLVARRARVNVRARKAVALAERAGSGAPPRAREVRLGPVGGQDPAQAVPALAAGEPGERALDRGEVERCAGSRPRGRPWPAGARRGRRRDRPACGRRWSPGCRGRWRGPRRG